MSEESPSFLFWLSFADASLPEGQQFLGAVIAEGETLEAVIIEAHVRGCNPGGEVASVGPISPWWPNILEEFKRASRWVLMDRETMDRLGLDPVKMP